MTFSEKSALVTGAGHGIGEATAKLLAEKGAAVVCNSKSDSCKRVAEEINGAGGKSFAFVADITDSDAVKVMVEKTIEVYGRLDILINNAGWWRVPRHQSIEEVKPEDWQRVLDVNLTGHFNCIRFAVPHMKRQGYGKIVNVGSGAGVVWSRTGIHAYASAKAGLGGLTRQLAKELATQNINVNCVAPDLVNTYPERRLKVENMTPKQKSDHEKILDSIPARRIGTSIDIANAIIFMASDEASYIHGQTLLVDGGRWMK
jgi:NAD(P)-dependent dehydrogenase (short-subunit alcohol dehydrogenase family)